MATVMTSAEFVAELKKIAEMKTVYTWGGFGFPITTYNIARLAAGYPKIYTTSKQAALKKLGSSYYGFDCVGLIKGVLWGWSGTQSANGGATYCSSGVPDIDCNDMFNKCSSKSSDFSKIEPGEFVWLQGHIGVYIGDGLVCEATAAWNNRVQITACGNIGAKTGYKTRKWTMHGKSPYIDYPATSTSAKPSTTATLKYYANLRKSPLAISAKICRLSPGTAVTVLGATSGGYIQVKYGNVVGWIVKSAL